ncbi:MAG TPA: HipA N-terminal domain-containing protein [Bacteroidota bacterium]|nr:HipA N-terminal domain-containing protein [Bacteroidota bacterium]
MSRKGNVYYQDQLAGIIEEDDDGYRFTYNDSYLTSDSSEPVSLTLPLRKEPYTSKTMIPFFDGLIPEGWLLEIVEKNWKVSARDRMGLLLTCCKDCIGAVGVMPIEGGSDPL